MTRRKALRLYLSNCKVSIWAFGLLGPGALPAFAPLGHEALDQLGVGGVVGDIGVFLGVGLVVVEFGGFDFGMIVALDPDGKAVAVGAHGVAHERFAIVAAGVLAEYGGFPGALRVVQHGFETGAFQMAGQGQAGQIAQGGVDIDEFNQGVGTLAGLFHVGNRQDQRGVGVVFAVAVFAPGVVFAQLPAVIAPDDDDGIPAQVQAVQFIQHLADLRVGIAGGGVIAVFELTGQVIGDGFLGDTVIGTHFTAGEDGVFGGVFGQKFVGSQLNLGRIVEVPVALGRDEGEMGLDESNGQEEWLLFSGQVTQCFYRQFGDFAIGEGVVGDIGAFEGRAAGVKTGDFLAFAVCVDFVLTLVERQVFRQGIAHAGGILPGDGPGGRIVVAAVVNLAHTLHEIAVLFEMLAESDHVGDCGPEMGD